MDLTESEKDTFVNDAPNNDVQTTDVILPELDQPDKSNEEDRLCFPPDSIREEGASSGKPDFISSILDDSFNQEPFSTDVAATPNDECLSAVAIPFESSESTEILSKSSGVLEGNMLDFETEKSELPKNDEMDVDDGSVSKDDTSKTGTGTQNADIDASKHLEKAVEVMAIDEEDKTDAEPEPPTTNIDEITENTELKIKEATIEADANDSTIAEDATMEDVDNNESETVCEEDSTKDQVDEKCNAVTTETIVESEDTEVTETDSAESVNTQDTVADEQTALVSEDQPTENSSDIISEKCTDVPETVEQSGDELSKSPIPVKEDSNDIQTCDVPSSSVEENASEEDSTKVIQEDSSLPTASAESKSEPSAKEAEKLLEDVVDTTTQSVEEIPESTEQAIDSTKQAIQSPEQATESMEQATDSSKQVTEDAEQPTEGTEQFTESTEQITGSTEQATESTEQASESIVQSTESTEHAIESKETVSESAEHVTESIEPATESTKTATESAQTATESTEQATESTEQTAESIESATESTAQATESTEPATKSTEQAIESTTPPCTSSTPVCNNVDQISSEETTDSDPVFVHVSTGSEKPNTDKNVIERTSTDNQEEEDFQESQPQEDPIASDTFAPVPMEEDAEEVDQNVDEQMDEEQGASEEMCIIPDTERIISQAEKDAAVSMIPLRDPTDSEFFSSDPSSDGLSGETSGDKRRSCNPENYVVSLCIDENVNLCMQCCLPRKSKYSILHKKVTTYICDDGCLNNFKRRHNDKIVMNNEGDLRVKKLTSGINNDNMIAKVKFSRKCIQCQKRISTNQVHLSWETMEYCNERCLSKYQKKVASNCSNCNTSVRNNCLGKYCVRFGYNIRQFCSSVCLEEFKKGLKVCSYCQKDMSTGGGDGFLAPVGDKGQFKDFCTQSCMEKYDIMSNNRGRQVRKAGSICSVCSNEKPITIEFEHNNKINLFCGEPCFVAFKFVNNITPAKCNMCKKYFDNKILEENSMYYENSLLSFCSNSCQNIYIIRHRKIVSCSWCKVKKYNFDMIQRISATGTTLLMCSLNCLSLYRISINAVHSKKTNCDHCQKNLQPLYHLTMSDASMRNFCSYPCVMAFQSQFPKTPITLNEPEETAVPVPTGGPKRSKRVFTPKQPEPVPADVPTIPVISSVQSLATTNGPSSSPLGTPRSNNSADSSQTPSPPIVKTQIKQHFIIKPAPIPSQRNIGTLCKVNMQTKGVNCKPTTCNVEVQTDEIQEKTAIIPIPLPLYVPAPMWMYSMPLPVPFPFPLPVPVPIFIPTTRNSANGIMKEIKKIQVKIPADPFEAELLMMAEMVAGDKKDEHTDSESEEEDTAPPPEETTFSPEPVDPSNTFGDDMLQMALKMATELDEPAVDLEGALTANTITASQGTETPAVEETTEESQPIHQIMERQSIRGRKRPGRPPKTSVSTSKRGRRSSSHMEIPIMPPPQPPPPQEPVEKPDANMCLKYTFGVNAWKQWVTTKNAELEKTSRRVKLFKPEILQLTADELNYSLCLFVKEVRKPNGQEYAPDTIYYLCLGIQQYLFENARIDNIFCDSYYEKFTDCLDEVAKKFSVLYNDSHYIVTRVEEEHLWESKQLGAHSPHVLLSTLMFFNTKHFNLTTVDEHMQLSFSHIMKHWKRNPNQPGTAKVAGSRNVLLRFYPPQSNNTDTTQQRKKKVYEQQENEDNPLRCPVKLYEFYLSKCPESVKTRNDVFYLLPERSCVPDSPVWYSTMPLPRAALEKMLHRVKMVKEINVALLTS